MVGAICVENIGKSTSTATEHFTTLYLRELFCRSGRLLNMSHPKGEVVVMPIKNLVLCFCLVLVSGWVTAQETPENLSELREKAAAGDAQAQADLSWALLHTADSAEKMLEVVQLAEQSAEAKSPRGLNVLGAFYLHGRGVPQIAKKHWSFFTWPPSPAMQRAGYLAKEKSKLGAATCRFFGTALVAKPQLSKYSQKCCS